MISEYCDGGSLKHCLEALKARNRTLSENQIVMWLIEILRAVKHFHKAKISHRDLRTDNIFLRGNQIKTGDFSINRIHVQQSDSMMADRNRTSVSTMKQILTEFH